MAWDGRCMATALSLCAIVGRHACACQASALACNSMRIPGHFTPRIYHPLSGSHTAKASLLLQVNSAVIHSRSRLPCFSQPAAFLPLHLIASTLVAGLADLAVAGLAAEALNRPPFRRARAKLSALQVRPYLPATAHIANLSISGSSSIHGHVLSMSGAVHQGSADNKSSCCFARSWCILSCSATKQS